MIQISWNSQKMRYVLIDLHNQLILWTFHLFLEIIT